MMGVDEIRRRVSSSNPSIELAVFCFLDIETSGLFASKGARITEIALLDRGGERFYWDLSESAGSNKPLANQLPGLFKHLQSGIVVGHNVTYDLKFIASETERSGFAGFRVKYIDTLALARKLRIEGSQGLQLQELLQYFNIQIEGQLHTARVDAKATRALFWKLVEYGELKTLNDTLMKQLSWS